MIVLDESAASFWHPDGDKDGNPVKVVVDRFKVLMVRTDYLAKTVEVSGVCGYLDNGAFVPHRSASGSMQLLGITLVRDSEDKPEFTEFLDAVSQRGAPKGNFRLQDVEELLIAKGHVKGSIVSDV